MKPIPIRRPQSSRDRLSFANTQRKSLISTSRQTLNFSNFKLFPKKEYNIVPQSARLKDIKTARSTSDLMQNIDELEVKNTVDEKIQQKIQGMKPLQKQIFSKMLQARVKQSNNMHQCLSLFFSTTEGFYLKNIQSKNTFEEAQKEFEEIYKNLYLKMSRFNLKELGFDHVLYITYYANTIFIQKVKEEFQKLKTSHDCDFKSLQESSHLNYQKQIFDLKKQIENHHKDFQILDRKFRKSQELIRVRDSQISELNDSIKICKLVINNQSEQLQNVNFQQGKLENEIYPKLDVEPEMQKLFENTFSTDSILFQDLKAKFESLDKNLNKIEKHRAQSNQIFKIIDDKLEEIKDQKPKKGHHHHHHHHGHGHGHHHHHAHVAKSIIHEVKREDCPVIKIVDTFQDKLKSNIKLQLESLKQKPRTIAVVTQANSHHSHECSGGLPDDFSHSRLYIYDWKNVSNVNINGIVIHFESFKPSESISEEFFAPEPKGNQNIRVLSQDNAFKQVQILLDLAQKYILGIENGKYCETIEYNPLKINSLLEFLFLYYFEETNHKSQAIVRVNEMICSLMRIQDNYQKYSQANIMVELLQTKDNFDHVKMYLQSRYLISQVNNSKVDNFQGVQGKIEEILEKLTKDQQKLDYLKFNLMQKVEQIFRETLEKSKAKIQGKGPKNLDQAILNIYQFLMSSIYHIFNFIINLEQKEQKEDFEVWKFLTLFEYMEKTGICNIYKFLLPKNEIYRKKLSIKPKIEKNIKMDSDDFLDLNIVVEYIDIVYHIPTLLDVDFIPFKPIQSVLNIATLRSKIPNFACMNVNELFYLIEHKPYQPYISLTNFYRLVRYKVNQDLRETEERFIIQQFHEQKKKFKIDQKLSFQEFSKILKEIQNIQVFVGQHANCYDEQNCEHDSDKKEKREVKRLYFKCLQMNVDQMIQPDILDLDVVEPQQFAKMLIKEKLYGFGKFRFIDLYQF